LHLVGDLLELVLLFFYLSGRHVSDSVLNNLQVTRYVHSTKLYSVTYKIRHTYKELKFNEIPLSFISLIVIIINVLKN